MKNGIYKVSFSSNSNDFGGGLIAVSNGAVNGGDQGFLYQGKLQLGEGTIAGSLHIKQHDSSTVSVFGPITEFDLDLQGTSDLATGSFVVNGSIRGKPEAKIDIRGKFISALVE